MNRRTFLTAVAVTTVASSALAQPLSKSLTVTKTKVQVAASPSKQVPTMKAIRKSLAAKPAVPVTPQMKRSFVYR